MAFDADLGGVIDSSSLGAFHEYGINLSKRLQITHPFGVGGPTTSPLPVSGTGAFATSSITGYNHVSVDFVELSNTGPGEQIVEFGVTALSVTGRDYGNVSVTGRLAGGGITLASRQINEAAGSGDTFYGFTAPAGEYFVGFDLDYDGAIVPDKRLWFDDIGFRTARVGQQRLEMAPAVDAQAQTTDGTNWLISDGGFGIITEKSVDSPVISERDDEQLGILEFDISALAGAQSVESAILELDVNLTETASGVGSASAKVFAYVGDGIASPSDPDAAAVLIGTSHGVSSTGFLSIALDTTVLESLAGEDFLGLLVTAGNPNRLTMRFDTSEFSAASQFANAARLTVDYTPVPEPAGMALLGLGVFAGMYRRPQKTSCGPVAL